jgi:hypothetical protein
MTRCSTGRATQKYKGGGTDLSDILETQGDIIYADSTLTAENLTISGTPGDVLKVSVSGVPEWGTSTSQWVTSGSDISYITGHVGIGTTTPDANLHVNGNAFVSSNLALGGVLSMGTVNVVARHTLSAITATGNLTPHTVIFDHPTTAFVTTANVSVGGELSVVGNVAVDTNTLFVDSVNNRVGIGTTTPGSTLDVNGSLRAAYDQDVTSYIGKSALGGITYGATFAHKDMNTQFRYALRQTSAGQTMINTKGDQSISFRVGDTEKAKITSGGDFLVDTNTLYVDASENRVGLGTTTPGYTLDVLGDINFSGALTQNGTTYGGGGSGSSQWVTSGNNIHYPTGDVGIGTTTPGYDLDVIGDINFSGNVRRRGIVQPLSGSDVSYSTVENAVSTWTGRTIDANAWYGVTWSPELSLFVAVAGSGTNRVATSPDGITWTGRTIDANNWIDVTWSPELSLFVAVAGSGTYRVATSPDGITWTSRTIDANKWNSVTWSPELSLFVAVAGSGTYQVATSPDGITWTGRTIDASSWRNVTWSPELSLFVAVASTGTYRVATSPDGITWTSRTIDANSWYGITWSPELSLFVAVATSGTNRVATSPDGIAWTGRTIGVNAWSGVTWSPELSLFVAVAISDTNRVATSPDGITWTSRTIDDANDWRSVTWSPELSLFVAVASNGTNRVATSNLGIPTPLNTPMALPGQLVVDTPTGNVGIGTTTPDTTLHIINPSTTSGARQYGLHIGGKGADIVPIINASAGGLTVNTVAGLEITSVDTNISAHGRHALIESVSAGSTYNTDIEFLARSGVGYMYSGGTQPATKQARIAHNGYIYARVGTSATGADYAELFEWDDGNPENEDRTGMTVKLMEGGKICITDANTSPNAVIGVISAIYGFLGNNHWDEWVGKYLKDSLGRVVTETVDMVTWRDEDDKEHTFTINTIPDDIEVPETATYYQDTDVPKLNPKYDKTLKYTERGKRKEWGAVGLVGRLRVLKTYPKSSRWIKLQDIDSEVEEYLAV